MVMDNVESRVKAVIADCFVMTPEELKDSDNFIQDLGADSLDVVELAMELEKEFDIEIPDEKMQELDTVGKLIDYVQHSVENS